MDLMIIDDHSIFLDGLGQFLKPHFDRIECYSDPQQALNMLMNWQPDMILLDMQMPGLDGESLMMILAKRQLAIPVVFLTASEDIGCLRRILDAGAQGILSKQIQGEQLISALTRIDQGEVVISDPLRQKLFNCRRSIQDPFGLSSRQIQVLALLAKGYANRQIAEILYLSEHTVKSHLKTIYSLLQVSCRTAAVAKAEDAGLL